MGAVAIGCLGARRVLLIALTEHDLWELRVAGDFALEIPTWAPILGGDQIEGVLMIYGTDNADLTRRLEELSGPETITIYVPPDPQ